MTILVSDLGDTVIGGFKRGVLQNDLGLTSQSNPRHDGRLKTFMRKLGSLTKQDKQEKEDARKERDLGLEEGRSSEERSIADEDPLPKTLEELATENVTEGEMMRRLAFAIRHVAEDLKTHPGKQYNYEEWVEFTRLIRFSKFETEGKDALQQLEYDEAVEGVVEWDWLDEHSPMTSEQSESEWVLDRLCESLLRIFKKGDLLLGATTGGQTDGKPQAFQQVAFRPPQPSDTDVAVDDADEEEEEQASAQPGMNVVTKFFRGEVGYGQAPRWSKRAKAKMAAAETATAPSPATQAPVSIGDRRRSSVSITHRRHGPFALNTRRSASIAGEADGGGPRRSMDISP